MYAATVSKDGRTASLTLLSLASGIRPFDAENAPPVPVVVAKAPAEAPKPVEMPKMPEVIAAEPKPAVVDVKPVVVEQPQQQEEPRTELRSSNSKAPIAPPAAKVLQSKPVETPKARVCVSLVVWF